MLACQDMQHNKKAVSRSARSSFPRLNQPLYPGRSGGESVHGRSRCTDNIFIERLWRSLKREAVYLEEIQDGFRAQRAINNRMTFYNIERPHSAHERRTPRRAYWDGRDQKLMA